MAHDDPFTLDLFGNTALSSGLGLGITAFGDEIGVHARLAYGASALPLNSPIEIEGIFKLSA